MSLTPFCIDISINDIPDEIFICQYAGDDFIVIDINTSAETYLPYSKNHIIGYSIMHLFKEYREDFYTILQNSYTKAIACEFDLECVDGVCRWHRGSVKKLANDNLIIFFKNRDRVKDIVLDEIHEQFKKITETSIVGVFMYQKNFIYTNKAFQEMTGYSAQELLAKEPWELVDKNSQEEFKKLVRRRLDGEMFQQIHNNARLVTKNNEEVCVRIAVETIRYRGQYAAMGTVVDITDLIVTDKKMKQLAQALEQTDDMLLISDAKGIITYVNDAFIHKYEYTRNELIGSRTNIIKSGEHEKSFYKILWDTILAGKKYKNKIVNRTKSGKLLYVNIIITPILDEHGNIESFVSTSSDITEDVKSRQKLEKLATKDGLTGIYNRYAIERELDYQITIAKQNQKSFALLILDIDFFKNVNDTYGHYVGDIVLKEMSNLIQMIIRSEDKFGRWGGEEFVVLLLNTSQHHALMKADEIREKIAHHLVNNKYQITVSIGVSVLEENDTKFSLLQRADKALYKAKSQGRNRVEYE